MLSGFNTNFRYRGVLFHVQTEDSGVENPHVITHLFHGGNIMASEKVKYAHLLEEADLEKAVKKLMEGQHKKMLKQLSRGEHDGVITERLGPEIFFVDTAKGSETLSPPAVTEEERPAPSVIPPRAAPRSPAMAEPTVLGADTLPPVAARTEPPPETTTALSKVFGDRVVSEKPLDEVVLDYLVENARKRRRQPK